MCFAILYIFPLPAYLLHCTVQKLRLSFLLMQRSPECCILLFLAQNIYTFIQYYSAIKCYFVPPPVTLFCSVPIRPFSSSSSCSFAAKCQASSTSIFFQKLNSKRDSSLDSRAKLILIQHNCNNNKYFFAINIRLKLRISSVCCHVMYVVHCFETV